MLTRGDGLSFPRRCELVLPAVGEPSPEVAELVVRLRDAVSGS